MNIRLFGCGKFQWLAIERFDRDLSPREERFYRKHRNVCLPCLGIERQGHNAMHMLNAATLEMEISDGFDERVLRAVHRPKRSLVRSLTPALAGAAVACLAIVAALQMIVASGEITWFGGPGSAFERANDDTAQLPQLVVKAEQP